MFTIFVHEHALVMDWDECEEKRWHGNRIPKSHLNFKSLASVEGLKLKMFICISYFIEKDNDFLNVICGMDKNTGIIYLQKLLCQTTSGNESSQSTRDEYTTANQL